MAEIILAVLAGFVIGCGVGAYVGIQLVAYAMRENPDKFINAIETLKNRK